MWDEIRCNKRFGQILTNKFFHLIKNKCNHLWMTSPKNTKKKFTLILPFSVNELNMMYIIAANARRLHVF